MHNLRPDLRIIADQVPQGAKVLDVGCGDGELLHWLVQHKDIDGRGMEMDREQVRTCLAKGLSVIQGDAEQDLDYFPKASHDIVILSRALQAMHDPVAVLGQLVRVGKQAIVSIPNFGYWRSRMYLAVHGRMPVTSTLQYEWYNTPNIHFCTLKDFHVLCDELSVIVNSRICVNLYGERSRVQKGIWLPNLMAEQGIFIIEAPK